MTRKRKRTPKSLLGGADLLAQHIGAVHTGTPAAVLLDRTVEPLARGTHGPRARGVVIGRRLAPPAVDVARLARQLRRAAAVDLLLGTVARHPKPIRLAFPSAVHAGRPMEVVRAAGSYADFNVRRLLLVAGAWAADARTITCPPPEPPPPGAPPEPAAPLPPDPAPFADNSRVSSSLDSQATTATSKTKVQTIRTISPSMQGGPQPGHA